MENCKICSFRGNGVEPSGTGFNVDYHWFSRIKTAGNCLKQILAGHNITLTKSARVELHQVAAFAEAGGGELLSVVLSYEEVVGIVSATLGEVVARYAAAFKRQEPMARLGSDKAALNVNKLAWEASKNNAEFLVAPDTPAVWRFVPTNPRLLECAEPDIAEYRQVVCALVTGARTFNGHASDLFSAKNQLRVVISIDDPVIAEVLYTTTLSEAQHIWRGANKISANVVIKIGQLPEVIGDITLTT